MIDYLEWCEDQICSYAKTLNPVAICLVLRGGASFPTVGQPDVSLYVVRTRMVYVIEMGAKHVIWSSVAFRRPERWNDMI